MGRPARSRPPWAPQDLSFESGLAVAALNIATARLENRVGLYAGALLVDVVYVSRLTVQRLSSCCSPQVKQPLDCNPRIARSLSERLRRALPGGQVIGV